MFGPSLSSGTVMEAVSRTLRTPVVTKKEENICVLPSCLPLFPLLFFNSGVVSSVLCDGRLSIWRWVERGVEQERR